MKRIGIVTNSGWNIYNYRRPLLRAFMARGWEVHLFSPFDRYIDLLAETEYTSYTPIKYLSPRGVSGIRDARLLVELKSKINKIDLDFILTFTVKPNIYVPLVSRGSKILGTVTGLGNAFIKGGIVARIVQAFYRRAYKNSGCLAFHNGTDLDLFVSENVIAANRTHLIEGSGIETKGIQIELPLKSDRFVFLFLGRVMQEKGINELIKAAEPLVEKYPRMSLIIAGKWMKNSGVNKAKFKSVTDHPRINFLGHLDDMDSLWAMCNCLILPSYREGMPMAVLESMARGKPVIATDVAGCREAIKHGENGLLVPPKDAARLQNAMETMMLMSSKERHVMGLKGREIVMSRFDQNIIVEKYLTIIEREECG